MISCYLSGGLGNQLFQIFATLAYCIQHKKQFVFPYKKTYLNEKNRPTYWDDFLFPLKPHTTHAFSPTVEEIIQYNKYSEPYHTYFPIPSDIDSGEAGGNAMLKGFFQSDKYFQCQFDEIMEMTGLHYLRANTLMECGLFEFPEIHTVSMHFRMGDYKNIRCYHPVMSPEYYVSALNEIIKSKGLETAEVRVYCFFEKEDEVEIDNYLRTIRTQIKGENVAFVKIDEIHCDWKQMLIMSGCDDHIIANSTFSWWAAYMNPSPHKLVCYPDVWYGHQLYYINTEDLFPLSWRKIETDKGYYSSRCVCRK